MSRKNLVTTLLVFCLLLIAGAAYAQEATPEAAVPATLADTLDLPVCDEFIESTAPQPVSATDANAAAIAEPQGAANQSVLVFNLSVLDRASLTTLMRFQDRGAFADAVNALPVTALETLESDAPAGLYGWLVVYFDADGAPLCRSTGYPAIGAEGEGLVLVSLQGFITQMVSRTSLPLNNYQADEQCAFDAPQFCDAIFVGDAQPEVIEGSDRADLIRAGGGNDTVNANAGNDVVNGGDGADVISGGDGDDVISGGDGDDVIRGDDGDDVITGDGGFDTVSGDNGVDTVQN